TCLGRSPPCKAIIRTTTVRTTAAPTPPPIHRTGTCLPNRLRCLGIVGLVLVAASPRVSAALRDLRPTAARREREELGCAPLFSFGWVVSRFLAPVDFFLGASARPASTSSWLIGGT